MVSPDIYRLGDAMIVSVLVFLALVFGFAMAWFNRVRLRQLSWTTFAGVALTGAGAPVLIGQLIALVLAGPAQTRMDGCELDMSPCPEVAMVMVALPLMIGLTAGIAFVLSTLAMRLLSPNPQ